RLRPGVSGDLPGPGHRPIQRRHLADARERAADAAHARGYASARRTAFTAFYTSPVAIQAMHAALARLGVPPRPSCWSRAAALAPSSLTPRRACVSSAWNWIASLDGSLACCTPVTTSTPSKVFGG